MRRVVFTAQMMADVLSCKRTQWREPIIPQPEGGCYDPFPHQGHKLNLWSWNADIAPEECPNAVQVCPLSVGDIMYAGILLRIKNVRAERLHEITSDDIYALGCPVRNGDGRKNNAIALDWYKLLWTSIYKDYIEERYHIEKKVIIGSEPHNDYIWENNPWCWIYDFVIAEETELPANRQTI